MRTRPPIDAVTAVLTDQHEFTRRRVARALTQRQRYRYVEPQVLTTQGGFLISSPCCSRNVDPAGGVIDLIRIEQVADKWQLFSHDHQHDEWVLYDEFDSLDTLLEVVCVDSQRLFWP